MLIVLWNATTGYKHGPPSHWVSANECYDTKSNDWESHEKVNTGVTMGGNAGAHPSYLPAAGA